MQVLDDYDQLTQMLRPQAGRRLETLDTDTSKKSVSIQLHVSGELFTRVTQYPIIVELWDHCVGAGASGSKRRGYLRWFSEAERKTLSKKITRLRTWHLVRGTPQKVAITVKTLGLLCKATQFFANLDHYCSLAVVNGPDSGGPDGSTPST